MKRIIFLIIAVVCAANFALGESEWSKKAAEPGWEKKPEEAGRDYIKIGKKHDGTAVWALYGRIEPGDDNNKAIAEAEELHKDDFIITKSQKNGDIQYDSISATVDNITFYLYKKKEQAPVSTKANGEQDTLPQDSLSWNNYTFYGPLDKIKELGVILNNSEVSVQVKKTSVIDQPREIIAWCLVGIFGILLTITGYFCWKFYRKQGVLDNELQKQILEKIKGKENKFIERPKLVSELANALKRNKQDIKKNIEELEIKGILIAKEEAVEKDKTRTKWKINEPKSTDIASHNSDLLETTSQDGSKSVVVAEGDEKNIESETEGKTAAAVKKEKSNKPPLFIGKTIYCDYGSLNKKLNGFVDERLMNSYQEQTETGIFIITTKSETEATFNINNNEKDAILLSTTTDTFKATFDVDGTIPNNLNSVRLTTTPGKLKKEKEGDIWQISDKIKIKFIAS